MMIFSKSENNIFFKYIDSSFREKKSNGVILSSLIYLFF